MPGHIRLANEPAPESTDSLPSASGASISVAVAAEHPLMRRGLCQLLESEQGMRVNAQDDVESMLGLVARERPDVVVLDRSMSGGSRLTTIGELRERAPDTQVVVLLAGDPPMFVQRALTAGALGLVTKDATDEELPAAIRAAARGERYVSPCVAGGLEALGRSRTQDRLTPRETEVLQLIALGHTSVEIARKLHLSPRTIETHRAHIHGKLGMATRADLVRYALRHGLLGVCDSGG
jgi:two-component system, NarL family, response regulator NreC